MIAIRRVALVVVPVALAAGWYLFRPEKLFLDRTVNETFAAADSAGAAALASGDFHPVAHEASGRATLYRLAGGRLVLRLNPFGTLDGPDLRLYLVTADDARDDATVSGAAVVDLGPLRGNRGPQLYDVPADLDLSRYRAVTVWCRRFSVNFATAPLRTVAAPPAPPLP